MVLIYSIFIIFLISLGIYYYIRKDRQRDKNNLEIDWKNFLKSESLNDIKGIVNYGDKLIWNKYLLNEQLDKIIDVVNSRVTNFPELKKLENNAFNKKLHYNRILQ
jgi:hypothetical protein